MVGAGWDKEGSCVKSLYSLGFSGVEVGTVVEYPQLGNPKPRQFILDSGIIINHIGLVSPGVQIVKNNLLKYDNFGIPIGINIGINNDVLVKDAPNKYARTVEILDSYASYFALNISCPNIRNLVSFFSHNPVFLNDICIEVKRKTTKPIFIKISPDLSYNEIDGVIEVVLANKLAGIIACNTTINENIKRSYGDKWNIPGGLSGDNHQYREMTNRIISHIYKKTKGEIDIIGVGGVKDVKTALDKIKLGAKAVQVVTGLRYKGLGIARDINKGIIDYMEHCGIKSFKEVTGYGYKN